MSEMNEYTPELFELIDGDGNKKNFELIDAVELNGELYYAMIPAIEDDDYLNADCELVILKVIEEDGEELLASVEDEFEYEEIADIFSKRMEDALDMYDYDDEEYEMK